MRLSAPSWLVPGTWLENLRAAESLPWLEGIELLLFSGDVDARRSFTSELEGIATFASRFELGIHLPDPLEESAIEIARLCSHFSRHFVLHPPATGEEGGWAERIVRLREEFGERFVLEYTGERDFARAESALPGLPLCPDTGCLLREGQDPASWIAACAQRVRVIHLHSARGGKDHLPLDEGEAWLSALMPFLRSFSGLVEIEVFSRAGLETSRAALEAFP